MEAEADGRLEETKTNPIFWHATRIHECQVYLMEVDEFQLVQAHQVRTDYGGIQTNSEDALEYKDEYQQQTVDWRSTDWNYSIDQLYSTLQRLSNLLYL